MNVNGRFLIVNGKLMETPFQNETRQDKGMNMRMEVEQAAAYSA
jgi:hypothetical protein